MRDDDRAGRTWSGAVVVVASLAFACGAARELPALHRAGRRGDDSGPNSWTPMQHAVHKGQAAAVWARRCG